MQERKWFVITQSVLFVLAVLTMLVVPAACSDEDDVTKSPDCGSGRVAYDAKTGICRDQADGRILPTKCCGR
jgi:hypothetical protein